MNDKAKHAGALVGKALASLNPTAAMTSPGAEQSCCWCGAKVRLRRPILDPTCPDCQKKRDEERKQRAARRRTVSWWDKHCPDGFKVVDRKRLPDPMMHDEVQKWEFGPLGLLLVGLTGAGKTRAVWSLLKKVTEAGTRVSYYDSIGFGADSHRAAMDADYTWTARLAEVDLLVLDDLGKGKLTDRVQSDLFGVIDRRAADLKPMIITTQLKPTELGAMLTEDRRDALIRRMRENLKVRLLRTREQQQPKKGK